MMLRRSMGVACSIAIAAAACGGQAIVDEAAGGSGGTGTGSGITPTGTGAPTGAPTGSPVGVPTGAPTGAPTGVPTGAPTGTPTGAPDCFTLEGDFLSAFEQAVFCNACMNYDTCVNGPRIHDPCGCEVGASEMTPGLATAAEAAYEAWVAVGCGPWLCEQPCFPPETVYYCVPNGQGCGGVCAAAWLEND